MSANSNSNSAGGPGCDHSPDANTKPNLAYNVTGQGQPVVFTHGWLNSATVWSKVITELDGSVRSVSWDLRGHGESQAAPPGQYGRAESLGDMDQMVDKVGAPALLVGHSLGGYLSLAYAIENPERVSGLVLVAAGPGFRNPDSLRAWNESVAEMAARRDPPIPQGMEEISMHVDSMVLDRLGEIVVPTAVVVGERDKRFLASAEVFGRYLTVTQTDIVAGAGHMVHVSEPGAVAAAIRSLS